MVEMAHNNYVKLYCYKMFCDVDFFYIADAMLMISRRY